MLPRTPMEKGIGISHSEISGTILKTIAANKPRTRIRMVKFTELLVWARLYLGYQISDQAVMSELK